MTEIVQREYLEHQQFQGINVGNVKRKAEQNKTIPAVQVSYPQQKIGNSQRNTVSSEAKNKAHFTWGKKKKKENMNIFVLIALFITALENCSS